MGGLQELSPHVLLLFIRLLPLLEGRSEL